MNLIVLSALVCSCNPKNHLKILRLVKWCLKNGLRALSPLTFASAYASQPVGCGGVWGWVN
ncbi:hypothetical protein [Campylobacter troglodytis]|uniref:hypothetical protein n=1 Tax=Campylobacter troglodytis TaxID=654363 RepID=UPI0011575494|nr:hypothetical protein [Campylobacter troglodytis]